MSTLKQIFDGLGKKLQADFELLTNQFRHSLSTGEAREFVLKELLRQYLPARLGVEKGIIVSSLKAECPSKQIDIVIYDKLNTPVLYSSDNARIFPIEGVYAVIEVKSHLNVKELEKSIENIRSVTKLTKRAFIEQKGCITNVVNLYGKEFDCFPVLGFVFSYIAVQDLKKLKTKLEEKDDSEVLENNIDTICILNKAVITNRDNSQNNIIVTKEPSSVRCWIETADSLLLFYLLMMHVLPQTWMRPIRMTDYAQKITFGKFEI